MTTDAGASSTATSIVNETSVVNVSELRCGTWDDEVQSKVDACSFWMEGVILTITGKSSMLAMIMICHYIHDPMISLDSHGHH